MFEMKDIYGKMNKDHLKLMEVNQMHIENMLDYAIMELVEIAKNNDIFLVDNLNLCNTYEEIFDYLKHCSQKRIDHSK